MPKERARPEKRIIPRSNAGLVEVFTYRNCGGKGIALMILRRPMERPRKINKMVCDVHTGLISITLRVVARTRGRTTRPLSRSLRLLARVRETKARKEARQKEKGRAKVRIRPIP
jgi:hypothetical protein